MSRSAAKPAGNVASGLASRARTLDSYVARIERLTSDGKLAQRDATLTYAGAFLAFYVELEVTIEQLFMGILMGRFSSSPSVRALVRIESESVAKSLVGINRPYVDWLPFDETVRRARSFLSGGRPFTQLDQSDRDAFDDARIIRNAIAHGGRQALNKFERRLVTSSLPPGQRRPAGYLRGLHAPDQTRFNYVLASCVLAVTNLCAS